MATDGERPTRGGATSTAAADLFICFNSRSSSSSSLMKLPSKSLFSPARPGVDAGHGPAAASSTLSSSILYTSLSRRLRYSGSLRGGGQASPMFPPAGSGKKKAALEEPSSPKVTCIGQVRVKTRKQGKRMRAAAAARSRSRRRSEGGSFRERERQRYWAALPISICEAVRALGTEFNCFQPCGAAHSGCASSASPAAEREKADRKRPARSYCGAVFARWLVALNEEGEKEVVSHVLPEVVAKVEEGRLERLGDAAVVVEGEEEEGEYQVCVPPKNALLLMRCRSEPFRMASYTNRFWESPAKPEMGRREDEAEEEVKEEENVNATLCEVKAEIGEEVEEVEEKKGSEDVPDVQVKEEDSKVAIFVADESENTGRSSVCVEEEDGEGMKLNEEEIELGEEEQASDHASPPSEAPTDDDGATDEQIQEETPSKAETSSESNEREEREAIEEEKTTQLPQTHTLEEEEEEEGDDGEEDAQPAQIESPEKTEPIEEEDDEKEEEVKAIAIFESEEAIGGEEEADMAAQEVPPPATAEEKVREEEDGALPECLLLMLYEPKLSMEVSKETWVCSTDFFQWRPGKDRRPKLAGDTAVVGGGVIEGRRKSTDSRPSRPSGSRVAAVSAATAAAATAATGGRPSPPLSMATVVEEKLVKAAAYEPQVLTRCKSEPMRTSARLAPEACFWKSGRKMPQPPRRSLRADPAS